MPFLVAAMLAGGLSCMLLVGEVQSALMHSRKRIHAVRHLRESEAQQPSGFDRESQEGRSEEYLVELSEKVRQGVNSILGKLPMHLQLPAVTLFASSQRELDLLREQIPPALDSLSVAVGSGLSLVQAFERVAVEAKDPISSRFALVPQGIRAGLSMKESLAKLQREFPEGEMETLFITLELHYRTGGNLAVLLDHTATMQREDSELRRELSVKTAQARFSAKVVGILPLGLLAALTLFSTDYIAPFFTSAVGFLILVLALSMELVGYVLVKRASEVALS